MYSNLIWKHMWYLQPFTLWSLNTATGNHHSRLAPTLPSLVAVTKHEPMKLLQNTFVWHWHWQEQATLTGAARPRWRNACGFGLQRQKVHQTNWCLRPRGYRRVGGGQGDPGGYAQDQRSWAAHNCWEEVVGYIRAYMHTCVHTYIQHRQETLVYRYIGT